LYARTASFCLGTSNNFDAWDQGIAFFLPNMTWLQVRFGLVFGLVGLGLLVGRAVFFAFCLLVSAHAHTLHNNSPNAHATSTLTSTQCPPPILQTAVCLPSKPPNRQPPTANCTALPAPLPALPAPPPAPLPAHTAVCPAPRAPRAPLRMPLRACMHACVRACVRRVRTRAHCAGTDER
jgi:hypothetical protein